MKTESRLEKVLASGNLAVTSECGPPRGAVPEKVREKAEMLRGVVDGINVTDNQTAVVRMSSLSACILIAQMGLDPILQMVTRDRNRLAMQSDILGAYSHGINTMLCLSGDHPQFGDHPMAANVYDMDSVQLIQTVRAMRDEGKFQGGDDILNPPKMFIGAAANPFADPFELRVARLAKKAKAGVDFVQTQCIYNMDRMRQWVKEAVDMGVTEEVYILAGVTPMKSVGMARYMQLKVPGMDVPDAIIKRLQGVDKKKVADEGIKIACEQIEEFKEMKGVAGVHLMPIEWENKVPEIAEQAKVLPRPVV
jgi:methylenetetrahydrofolate reductase (NADPH)